MKLAALTLLTLLSAATLVGAAAPQDTSLEDLEKAIVTERDDVDPATIKAIAEMEDREAMEALLRAYDTFASIYMKREVVKTLGHFDDVEDAFQPALDKLMKVAVGADARELRVAALTTLGHCRENGRTFLALIVNSPADDAVRESALELHIRLSDEADNALYRGIYERSVSDVKKEMREANKGKKKKRKRKKKGEEPEPKVEIVWPTANLRGIAMEAILDSMKDDELVKAFEGDRSSMVKRTALAELGRRGHKKAPEYAEAVIKSVNFRGTDRALAAEILIKDQGADAADDLIDIALKSATPEVLRQRIAELLSDLKDDGVDKATKKLIAKGKAPQKTFALRATWHIKDDKLTKKIRKGLRDKDEDVVIATIDALAARQDRESLEDMEKLLKKTKSDDVRAAVLRGLSAVYDGENEWVDRLVEFTKADDLDLRNTALVELARLGRRNKADVFKGALTNEDWSTRLIALKALEGLHEVELLDPIIAQMQEETGRMEVEFGDSLFRLTGKPFGKRSSAWKRWLTERADEVALIDEDELEKLVIEAEDRRLKQVSNATFFGIRIESHRVLFIIDVSGSMNEPLRAEYFGESGRPRIDYAKEELIKAIEALDANALFNIAPFSSGVEGWLEDGVVGADDVTREDAIIYVERLGASGGTNLFGSIEFGFEDEDIDTIFILSDGEPSVGDIIDPQLIRDEVALMNETRNIVINTIAIGANLEILAWLAEDSGGTYVEIQ